jgi:hypothetical protein
VSVATGLDSHAARIALIGDAERAANRAEFARTRAMLEFAEDCRAEAGTIDNAYRRQAALSSIFDELSLALGWSVRQVQAVLFQAQTVRLQLPRCWFRHRHGEISGQHLRELSHAANQLTDAANLDLLDIMADEWLGAHPSGTDQSRTVAEFRRWLTRRIHRLEPDAHEARLRQAHSERKVRISHRDDGLSELWALIPTPLAAAIADNLRSVRAAQPASDTRTKDQWEADHVVDQLLCEPTTGEGVHARIGILIPVTSLAALDDQPGTSIDGSWDLPAALVRELAACHGTVFERVITSPAGRVLDVTHLGYTFTARQQHALNLRDGTCVFPTCSMPAEHCDTDHVRPYDSGGPTAGSNAQKLCRRHHRLKGHAMLPTPYDPPDRSFELDLELCDLWHRVSPNDPGLEFESLFDAA